MTPITKVLDYADGLQHPEEGIIKNIIEDFRDEGINLNKGDVLIQEVDGQPDKVYQYVRKELRRMADGTNFIEIVVSNV
jgi:hypothetical protein